MLIMNGVTAATARPAIPTVALLLSLLFRLSDTFIVPLAGPAIVPGSPASSGSPAHGAATGSWRPTTAVVPEARHVRRERLATLGKVRWRGCCSATDGAVVPRGGLDLRTSGFVAGGIVPDERQQETSEVLGMAGAVRIAPYRAMAMGTGRGGLMNKGIRRVRRVIGRALRRGRSPGGSQVRRHGMILACSLVSCYLLYKLCCYCACSCGWILMHDPVDF